MVFTMFDNWAMKEDKCKWMTGGKIEFNLRSWIHGTARAESH